MAGIPSPQYECAVELLADGEWHRRDVIVRQVAKTVPPGKAVRLVEDFRAWKAEKEGFTSVEERKIRRSQEFLIDSGQRAVATKVLNNPHRFEVKTEAGVKYIRMKPVLPHWRTRGRAS